MAQLSTLPEPGSSGTSRVKFILRAFRYRNYRLFFGGQIVSLIGTWVTTTASSWLVYRLTKSAFLLGMVGFASQLPAFLLAPATGVLVDRWNRHRLLIVTQILSMLESFALAYLTLTGSITVTAIILLNAAQGIINAFDMPCRQAFVLSLIEDKEDLGNVIGLNSSMFNAARLVGPTIAGLIIAASNEGWCFLLDGVSYLAVLAALVAMRLRPSRPAHLHESPLKQLHDGWRYVVGFVPIRSVLLLLALVSLVGVPYSVLIPVIATKILHGGADTLGFLMTASGCGALTGALWLASRRSVIGLGRVIPIATSLFGAALVAFSFARSMWLSLILLALAGFGFMVQMAASNTIVQTIVEDSMRGRVVSFFIMAVLGTTPFGSLMAGSIADRIGAQPTIRIGGALSIAGAFWFARLLPTLRPMVRAIYVKKGIIREVATGLQSASQTAIPPID